MEFNELPRHVARLDAPDGPELQHIPQFFQADFEFAWRIGGAFVREVLSAIAFASRWKYLTIDSRTHMLMKGMYPCIPGWHCDDFYRQRGYPRLARVMDEAPAEHVAIIAGNCSKTVFLDSPWTWDAPEVPEEGKTIYGMAHEQLQTDIVRAGLRTREAQSGELVWFSPISWHRGSPATHNGWRSFMRITGSNHRVPANGLRSQTQVYLTAPFAGW